MDPQRGSTHDLTWIIGRGCATRPPAPSVRRVRAASCVIALLLMAGCGSDPAPTADPHRPAPSVDAMAVLAGVPAAAGRAGTVSYESVTEGALDGEEMAVEASMSGVLDVPARAGTARVSLVPLAQMAQGAEASGETAPAKDLADLAMMRLAWTAEELTLVLGGEEVTGPRDEADSGLVAQIPDEPAGLFDVVAAASDVTVVGRVDVDGVATTHLRGSAQPRAAVDAGLGTQAQLSIARLADLPVEVWVDDEGRPARIRYTVELPSLQGRTRTMVTTYDYRSWGEPVDLTP